MGPTSWAVESLLHGAASTYTVSSGSNSNDTLTTTVALGASDNGKWVRFSAITGGSNLLVNKAYRILSGQGTTSVTLAAADGVTPVDFGSDISAATFGLIDTTHMSLTGSSFVNNIVMQDMEQLVNSRMSLNGTAPIGSGWARDPVLPSRLQTNMVDRTWRYAGPSNKKREIAIGKLDGSSTLPGYYTTVAIGANSLDHGYIAGTNGGGLCWTQNGSGLGIIGLNTNNSSNWTNSRFTATVNSRNDMLEVTSVGVGTWIPFAVSSATGIALNFPTQVWRHSATNTGGTNGGKGTEYAAMSKDQGLVFNEGTQGIVLKNTTHGRIGTGITLTSGVATVANATVTANTHVSITKTAHGAGVSGTGYVVTKLTAAADHVILATVTAGTDDNFTLTSHGFETGMAVSLSNSGGALPAATPSLAATTLYYVVRTGANTFKLAISAANAVAATPTVIDITGTGSGTHSVRTAAFVITSTDTYGATVTTDVGTFDWVLTERQ